jgi:hypothetical protein
MPRVTLTHGRSLLHPSSGSSIEAGAVVLAALHVIDEPLVNGVGLAPMETQPLESIVMV